MNKFRINLISEKKDKKNILFFACLIIVIVSLYFNVKTYMEVKERKKMYEQELAKIEPQYKQNITFNSLKNEVDYINNLLNIRSFSWSIFLSRLEKITPYGISISNIAPSFATREVMLNGIALSTNNLVDFMKNLQTSPFFSDVFITEQNEIEPKAQTITKLTGFTLTFKYNEK